MNKKIVVVEGSVSVNSEVYQEFEIIPTGILSKKQIEDLTESGVIQVVVEEKIEAPKAPEAPEKKKKETK